MSNDATKAWLQPGNVWFKCKACGQPAAYLGDGVPPLYSPGSIAHAKPTNLIRTRANEPSRVPCELYQRCSPEEYWEIHKHEPRIDLGLNRVEELPIGD